MLIEDGMRVQKDSRARRALGNISNLQDKDNHKKGAKGANDAVKAPVVREAKKGDARPGMTRMLIGQSERSGQSATTALVRRTQDLNLKTLKQDAMVSPMPDIDSQHKGDCLQCAEYAPDIFTFFRNMEPAILVEPTYMEKQEFINRQMRAVLIDWLIDTHRSYGLMPESLFLGIHIMDKFLSKYKCKRKELQLVGICSLIIANKYEEVYGPSMKDFAAVCGDDMKHRDVLNMEREILKTINFELTVPTSFTFLARYLKACPYGHYNEFVHLCQYLCEWALLSCTCLKHAGSMIAASAIHVSIKAFNLPDENGWPRALRKHSGYTHQELWKCSQYLAYLMHKGSMRQGQFKALYNKFESDKYSQVARYKAPVRAFNLDQFDVAQQAAQTQHQSSSKQA